MKHSILILLVCLSIGSLGAQQLAVKASVGGGGWFFSDPGTTFFPAGVSTEGAQYLSRVFVQFGAELSLGRGWRLSAQSGYEQRHYQPNVESYFTDTKIDRLTMPVELLWQHKALVIGAGPYATYRIRHSYPDAFRNSFIDPNFQPLDRETTPWVLGACATLGFRPRLSGNWRLTSEFSPMLDLLGNNNSIIRFRTLNLSIGLLHEFN